MCIRDRWYEESTAREPFLPVAGDGITVEAEEPYEQDGPVSYTHLDVYKRQQKSGFTAFLKYLESSSPPVVAAVCRAAAAVAVARCV